MPKRTLSTLAICAALAGPALAEGHDAPALGIADSAQYGRYVTAPDGMPVYAFITDETAGDNLPALVSCGPPCREVWPLVTVGSTELGTSEGMIEEYAATIPRDGVNVAVYGSNVLWYYVRDREGAEPQGHAISTYGGWWYLIGPDGDPLPRDLR